MSGTELKKILSDIIYFLGGYESPVTVRRYSQTSAQTEAGESPNQSYNETELLPRPLIIPPSLQKGETLKETALNARTETGYLTIVATADTDIQIADILIVNGASYEAVRIHEPVIFRTALLKVVLARRVQQ